MPAHPAPDRRVAIREHHQLAALEVALDGVEHGLGLDRRQLVSTFGCDFAWSSSGVATGGGHTQAKRTPLVRFSCVEHLGERHDRELRGVVRAEVQRRHPARDRREVHQVAAAALDHPRQHRVGDVHGAAVVDRHDAVHQLRILREQAIRRHDRGRVHHAVDRPELGLDASHRLGDRARVGDVDGVGADARVVAAGLAEARLVDVERRDLAPPPASRRAARRPMPLAAPVTNATLPWNAMTVLPDRARFSALDRAAARRAKRRAR